MHRATLASSTDCLDTWAWPLTGSEWELTPATFRALVERTAPRLHRVCARILGDGAEAEDILQEVYLKAHVALAARRFDRRSSIDTWLYRIATNVALNARRARRSREALHGAVTIPPLDRIRALEARDALALCADLIEQLPEEQRLVLVLKELEGLTSAEVAEVLDVSEGAVEQRLVRARATLRSHMETP
jgi:RNA polymerase sigma-70 factor (ECF subfamily)